MRWSGFCDCTRRLASGDREGTPRIGAEVPHCRRYRNVCALGSTPADVELLAYCRDRPFDHGVGTGAQTSSVPWCLRACPMPRLAPAIRMAAAMPLRACTRDSSAGAAPMSSFRREQTVSRHSGATFAPLTESATQPVLRFSPSPAIGSPPSRASRTACSPGSICPRRSMIKRSASARRNGRGRGGRQITNAGRSHLGSQTSIACGKLANQQMTHAIATG
jgi:hypothetical protein